MLSVPASFTYGTTGTAFTTGGSGTGAVGFSDGASTGCGSTHDRLISVSNASGSCSISASKAGDNDYNGPVTTGPRRSRWSRRTRRRSAAASRPASLTDDQQRVHDGRLGHRAVSFSDGASTGCTVDSRYRADLGQATPAARCSISASKAGDNNYNFPVRDGPAGTLVKANQAALVLSVRPASLTGHRHRVHDGGRARARSSFSDGASTGCAVDPRPG